MTVDQPVDIDRVAEVSGKMTALSADAQSQVAEFVDRLAAEASRQQPMTVQEAADAYAALPEDLQLRITRQLRDFEETL